MSFPFNGDSSVKSLKIDEWRQQHGKSHDVLHFGKVPGCHKGLIDDTKYYFIPSSSIYCQRPGDASISDLTLAPCV